MEKTKEEKEIKKEIKQECHCKEGEKCTCEDECTCDENCECKQNSEKQIEKCECDESSCKCETDQNQNGEDNLKKKSKKDKSSKKVKELETTIKTLEQKILMKDADLINYRKRKDEELSKMLKYSNEDLVKEILPTLDNFERAINMDDDNLDDEVSKFLSGFKMIYCHLKDVLEKFEVIAIDGTNKPFDPTYHQAVLTEKRTDLEPGMVIEVMQKGYLLKDKVIRPAMVRVSE